MTDTKISALTALTGATIATNDVLPIVDTSATTTKSITVQELLTGILGSTSITGATITTSNPLLDLSQTWNAGGVTFKGWVLNITDTASAAGSLLLDLQVGGSSKFAVAKTGAIQNLPVGSASAPSIVPTGATNSGIFWASAQNLSIAVSGSEIYRFGSGGRFTIGQSAGEFAIGSSVGGPDVLVSRDAANTLALRNSTSAQAFNIYNTFTDASNYERGFIKYSSNVLRIGHEGAGTGNNSRQVSLFTSGFDAFYVTSLVAHFNVNVEFETGYGEFAERTAPSAPGANKVRVYAEDNGSGKTRLMALFPTGAAQQIAIEP